MWNWVKNTRQSELVIVLGEDVAALFGLTFALIAVGLAWITGNPAFDAAGSIIIGGLLILVSLFLGYKIKGLLIGQSADEDTRNKIQDFLENRPEIEQVLNVITLQLGADIMVAIKAKMREVPSVENLAQNINNCEVELHKINANIKWIFFEPDIKN